LIFAGLNEKTFIDLSFDNNFFNKNFRILNNLKPTDSELQFLQYDFISSLYNKDVILSYSEVTSHSNDQICRWLEKLLSIVSAN
jgi:inactivated superfamily I helicase